MFGDIVKVTPSSKVVGDMALMMVSQGLTREEVEDPKKEVSFPDSVIDMMRGNLGQPPGGFPQGILKKVLKGESQSPSAPARMLAPVDLDERRAEVAETLGQVEVDDEDLNGYLMYPKVFTDYMGRHGPMARCAPCRRDLLLRHGTGRGDLGRDRPRQDAGNPAASGGRNQRGRRGPGVLRAQRPAPRDPRAQPQGQAASRRRPKAEPGQSQPHRRADARRGRHRRGQSRARRSSRATCC
jgi:hypothetical protein